jgi:N-acetylglucosamine-6-phosphate deacetylase
VSAVVTLLTGASVVLADRLADGLTVVIEGDRIVDLLSGPRLTSPAETRIALDGHTIVPGFIDVHVHGVAGHDVLDGAGAVASVAQLLPRWGVTAFCPTSVACTPAALESLLAETALARATAAPGSARVLPAHLESNFLNPDYHGAQPLACLKSPTAVGTVTGDSGGFSAREILDVIAHRRADIGIVTLAPELDGGLDLTRDLVRAGHIVSIGHTAATFDEACAAIAAGARQATHLFNRMAPMTHRNPGTVGAVLADDSVAAELICDGHHVHPAAMRVAIAAKGSARVMAISDGTAGSGLPAGAHAALGGRRITVGDVARLDDGTPAGSVQTMDRVFACLVAQCGIDLVRAAEMCSTTPARELGLVGHGVIAKGAIADLTVLDERLRVVQTFIAGRRVLGAGNLREFS